MLLLINSVGALLPASPGLSPPCWPPLSIRYWLFLQSWFPSAGIAQGSVQTSFLYLHSLSWGLVSWLYISPTKGQLLNLCLSSELQTHTSNCFLDSHTWMSNRHLRFILSRLSFCSRPASLCFSGFQASPAKGSPSLLRPNAAVLTDPPLCLAFYVFPWWVLWSLCSRHTWTLTASLHSLLLRPLSRPSVLAGLPASTLFL